VLCDGTGEANLAVEVARGRGLPDRRPLAEPGEEEIGTGRGRAEDSPSRGVAMAVVVVSWRLLSSDRRRLGFLSHVLFHSVDERGK